MVTLENITINFNKTTITAPEVVLQNNFEVVLGAEFEIK